MGCGFWPGCEAQSPEVLSANASARFWDVGAFKTEQLEFRSIGELKTRLSDFWESASFVKVS